MTRFGIFCAALLALGALLPAPAWADPCGMVPPITVGDGPPITRIGDQQTYVFYKDGIETIALRPGFRGRVDNFGMLIPFPSPPAIRKLPDDIFGHVAAAIDPPEVVVDLRRRWMERDGARAPSAAAGKLEVREMARDDVRVLRQEAVGMYEVAVLEAGSPAALKAWMDKNGYQYPTGMDAACADYVAAKWCFVAVKTKVAKKGGVDPRPGMKKADGAMRPGESFDGNVQAMGFRFRSERLVVPMRLSTFNEGELHNIVYVLSDDPLAIKNIPQEFVKRQISGEQLYRNVTQPLPLRIIGGYYDDIPQWRLNQLPAQRNAAPHNGHARELFASDLLALKHKRLSNPLEEYEKELLRIGEALDMRGKALDDLHHAALKAQRDVAVKSALEGLKGMTMTVVKGDFPREVLARENLTFTKYEMPTDRNSPSTYDALRKGPAPRRGGIVLVADDTGDGSGLGWLAALALIAAGGFLMIRATTGRRLKRAGAPLVVALLAIVALTRPVSAKDVKGAPKDLTNPKVRAQLIERGEASLLPLSFVARRADPVQRGWAIVCMAEIGGTQADTLLAQLVADGNQQMLVRNWAAAARVRAAPHFDALLKLAPQVAGYPAVQRPLGLAVTRELAKGGAVSVDKLLTAVVTMPQLQGALGRPILAAGAEALVKAMATHPDDNARRLAAGYLAGRAQQGDKSVAEHVTTAYRFSNEAADVPWQGGALFVPNLGWQKNTARALVRDLVAWHLWAERHGRKDLQQQIHNNLRSLSLARAAGYRSPGWRPAPVEAWLAIWGGLGGKESLERLLFEQGVQDEPRYRKVVGALR